MSAPNRWTTQASFTSALGRPGRDVAAQPGVLERKLLDAGEQHAVEMILPAEVLLAVLEQPARQRQEDAALDEEDDAAGDRPMGGEGEMRLQAPLDVGVEQLGQERRVEVALLDGAGEHRPYRLEDFLVVVVGGAAALDQVAAQPGADVVLDLAHHGVDANLR